MVWQVYLLFSHLFLTLSLVLIFKHSLFLSSTRGMKLLSPRHALQTLQLKETNLTSGQPGDLCVSLSLSLSEAFEGI